MHNKLYYIYFGNIATDAYHTLISSQLSTVLLYMYTYVNVVHYNHAKIINTLQNILF